MMEYPFKDLLPLDEVLEREGYYTDWTHLDPEVFYSLTQISEYIKTKGFGVDVRLLIAQLAEHFGLSVVEVTDIANELIARQDNLETQTAQSVSQMEADKNAVIANATVDSEVILARGGKATLGARLDDTAAQLLAQKTYVDSELSSLKKDINDNEVSVLEYGALGDGIKDNTLEIQECFNNETNVYFPDGIFMTNDLEVPSNINIRLSKDTYVVKIPTSESGYEIFNLIDVKNVNISGGYIQGDRDSHSGTSGEWGMGISLRGTTNVKIYNTEIIDCWGDGIYVGVSENQDHCKDTIIDNVTCDNNRRQGISIVSAINLKLNNVHCANTNGTNPSDGIDIEPNNNSEHLENIVFNNVTTENNAGAGITIFLPNFSDTPNKMNIAINNHMDNGSDYGFRIIGESKNIDGTITMNNPIWKGNNGESLLIDRHDHTAGFINIVDPVLYSNSSTTIPYHITHSLGTTKENPVHGNISVIRPKLIIEKNTTPPVRMFFLSQGTASKIKDIDIIDPQILGNSEGMSVLNLSSKNMENLNYSDKYKLSVIHSNATGFTQMKVNPYPSMLKYDNGANILIGDKIPIGLPITIVNNSGEFTTLQFSDAISRPVYYQPLGSANSISSLNKGSKITFVRLSENELQILDMVGEWTTHET